ncbi:hypothetical protein DFQ11_102639 [Winogradskyella epiphytica]|uniref:Uncharacterized protein n=1 Tax=Winogradskyella epiphytica TaxID=262005 RepID=A0A2V4X8V5_9FLAO|nr:hypothetical protein [Winogradskyella epiphytica]PYE82059.1 hypothetical protein DFQ11_102639 [Winogradskyella epiphytica]GGW60759.1 hypothetical protein GCM10008085_10350 [Winogradskyella epiphytica]
MSVFEDMSSTTGKASDIGERYIRASHQYLKLKVFQQLTLSLTLMTKVLAIGSFLFAGLVFLSIAGALKLGNSLGSFSLGFLLVGLIYLVLAIIIYMLRTKFNYYIIKKVGNKFFN